MKKAISLSLSIAVVSACQQDPESLEQRKKQLGEKQKQLTELKDEIKELKSEIASLDTITEEGEITPVVIKKLAPENFEYYAKHTGIVDSRENILLSAEALGKVKAIKIVEGQKVSKGAILIELDNDAVANQLEEAKAMFDLAQTTFERRKVLWEQKIGSEIEYLQAESSYKSAKTRLGQIRAQYENTITRSPINGTIDNIRVNVGEFVRVGTPIGRVVDLSKIEIKAELSEIYLPNVKEGNIAKVNIPVLGIKQEVPVSFVSQVINPDNRSFTIKVRLDNEDNLIKPNALAELVIKDYQNENALVVPSMIINKDLKGDFVYITASEDNKKIAKKKYVKTGGSFKDMTEIKSGLNPGDEVIIIGYSEVHDGEEVALR